jgi:hypothetical protein
MIEMFKKSRLERKEKFNERRVAEKVSETGLDDFVRYLRSPWRIVWSNFLAGIFRGLGFIIGATVVLAISVYVLVQILGNIPVVGEFFQEAGGFIQNIQDSAATLKGLGK